MRGPRSDGIWSSVTRYVRIPPGRTHAGSRLLQSCATLGGSLNFVAIIGLLLRSGYAHPAQQPDEMLVSQRTQAINALRGHAAEFGVVAAKGIVKVAALLSVLAADNAIPATARAMFRKMGAHIEALDQHVEAMDDELAALHKANPVSQLLVAIPASVRLARSPWP